MVSEFIQKQVEDIQEQDFKRLRELSILVLSLTVAISIDYWFSEWWTVRPSLINLPNADWIALGYQIHILVVSFVIFIVVVSYFWWSRNKPQFLVLFIGDKKNQKQNNDKRPPTWGLIPVIGVTIGLVAFMVFDQIFDQIYNPQSYWWAQNHYKLYGFHPLISAVCFCVLLYFVFRIKPARVQRSLPGVLLISIILSSILQFYFQYLNAQNWYLQIVNNSAPAAWSAEFIDNVTGYASYTLFLASFIVLFYLVYHVNAGYGKSFTFVEGQHTRGVIKDAVYIQPKCVNKGDSYNIPLDLTISEDFSGYYLSKTSSDYLEAELQAVGLEVDGEKQVRIYETSQIPLTTWNCRFAESGIHAINFMIHLVKPSNNSRSLIFSQTHDVKVRSFLSASLLPVLTLIIPILVVVLQAWLKVKP